MRNDPTFLHSVYNYSGTPYEIGYQRGKKTKELLKRGLDPSILLLGYPRKRNTWLSPENYNIEFIKANYPRQYKEWERGLEKAPEWFTDEIRGNAEGAGVDYNELLIASSNTSWFPIFIEKESEKGDPSNDDSLDIDDDCCGFVVFGKGSEGDRVIIGGNAETDHESIRYLSIIRMKNKKGNSFVGASKYPWMGGAQCGVNEKGVCIFGSGVSVIPTEIVGTYCYPSQTMRRIVLQEANNLDEAIDIIKESPRYGGKHIYLGDPKRAVHIEFTAKHIEVIDPEEGFDAGSSSIFTSPKMLPFNEGAFPVEGEAAPDIYKASPRLRTIYRVERFHQLFQEKRPLKLADIPSILGDHGGRGSAGLIREWFKGAVPQGSPYTICAHGAKTPKRHGSFGGLRQKGSFHAHAYSNIEVPDIRTLYIACGNPCEAGYLPFTVP